MKISKCNDNCYKEVRVKSSIEILFKEVMIVDFVHIPVLLNESIKALDIKPDGKYLDATMGGAGHSEQIAKLLTTGRLFSVDKDPDAIAAGSKRLKKYSCVTIIESDFSQVHNLKDKYDITDLDGILMDLGVSSHQLDAPERGFSYHNDAFLDMRMSKSGVSAYDLINNLEKDEISRILFEYAEESFAGKIARNIVEYRKKKAIETTGELVEIIKNSLPEKVKRKEKHPARKTFQALRIAVNDEMGVLERGLDSLFSLLKPQGRLAVISFHSIEDRIVKRKMAYWAKPCVCPPGFPICVCDKEKTAKLISRKPIVAGDDELSQNSRSRSAKLRVCEKI